MGELLVSDRPRRPQSTRQQIGRRRVLDAARDLFRAQGFYATTIEQIVEYAGCTRGAVYCHFDSKDALAAAVLDDLYRTALGRMGAVQVHDLDQLITTATTWCHAAVTRSWWMRLELSLATATPGESQTSSRLFRLGTDIGDLLTRNVRDLGLDAATDGAAAGHFLLVVLFGIAGQHPATEITPALLRPHVELVLDMCIDSSPDIPATVPGY